MSAEKCSALEANKWVFIGDTEVCDYSKKQVGIAKDLGLQIKGAILCNDPEHAKQEVCRKVQSFPTFCNTETQLRETLRVRRCSCLSTSPSLWTVHTTRQQTTRLRLAQI